MTVADLGIGIVGRPETRWFGVSLGSGGARQNAMNRAEYPPRTGDLLDLFAGQTISL
jgi:hypothetical protein